MRRFSRSERTGKKQTETGRLFSLAIRRREHAAAVYQHCSFDFEKERKARGSGERGDFLFLVACTIENDRKATRFVTSFCLLLQHRQ